MKVGMNCMALLKLMVEGFSSRRKSTFLRSFAKAILELAFARI